MNNLTNILRRNPIYGGYVKRRYSFIVIIDLHFWWLGRRFFTSSCCCLSSGCSLTGLRWIASCFISLTFFCGRLPGTIPRNSSSMILLLFLPRLCPPELRGLCRSRTSCRLCWLLLFGCLLPVGFDSSHRVRPLLLFLDPCCRSIFGLPGLTRLGLFGSRRSKWWVRSGSCRNRRLWYSWLSWNFWFRTNLVLPHWWWWLCWWILRASSWKWRSYRRLQRQLEVRWLWFEQFSWWLFNIQELLLNVNMYRGGSKSKSDIVWS